MSRKLNFLIFLGGLITAVGVVFLLNYALSGPKLMFHYDFFQNRRKLPPVINEILVINSKETVESSDVFSVLMSSTEMGASSLILEAQVLGSSSLVFGNEAEILRRFSDEYSLVKMNIRNLFEAIRIGSISPVESPIYVERLVELTEKSRDRLTSEIIVRDEQLSRAAMVFGQFWETSNFQAHYFSVI